MALLLVASCGHHCGALAPPPPVGAIRAGAVTRVESYGAFVRLDGCGTSGLVHVSELAAGRVGDVSAAASVGMPVVVKVLPPREPGRAAFSLKAVDQRTGAGVERPRRAAPAAPTSTRMILDDCDVSYVRASGAGGQRVNKVSTKCELRFDVDRGGALPAAVRGQLKATHAARLTKGGELLLSSDAHRAQRRNAADALGRLQAFVDAATAAATPATTPPAKKKRLKSLARRGERKRRGEKERTSQKKAARRGRVDDG